MPGQPIGTLRRLAVRLGAGELGQDGVWLGEGLQRYLDQACQGLTLAAALGLEPSWWLAERRARRDAALREFAERFLPEKSTRAKAFALGSAIRRYQATAWLRDRKAGHSPDRSNDRNDCLFRASAAAAGEGDSDMPTSISQLERILTDCSN